MRHIACAGVLPLLPAFVVAQEKTLPTPPSITTEGIPPTPQSVADSLSRYAQFRQAQMMAWNPAKRQILITTALGERTQLYAVDGPGRDRRQITWYERGMPIFTSVSFDPADANTIVFQFDPEGNELRPLYRYDVASGDTSLLTSSKTRDMHVCSRTGKWRAF